MGGGYKIVNHSNWSAYRESLEQIKATSFEKGDIIILIGQGLEKFSDYVPDKNVMRFYNLKDAFDRPHVYGEIFFDTYHTNHRGYRLIADKIYNILDFEFNSAAKDSTDYVFYSPIEIPTTLQYKKNSIPNRQTENGSFLKSNGIEDYIEFIKKTKVSGDGIIGSIVMNCNPFTLGHRFLIESAMNLCDHLYIFVVQEDKSTFPFADRYELVKVGVSDLLNVSVLPSGQFILSDSTLPEYFNKETKKDVIINASLDIRTFATMIAPVLNITKRFAGEEPFDLITRQYNQAMNDILPKYGISFIEIPRKEESGAPISASSVRTLLEKNNFDKIKKLIPQSTLEYLKNNCGQKKELIEDIERDLEYI